MSGDTRVSVFVFKHGLPILFAAVCVMMTGCGGNAAPTEGAAQNLEVAPTNAPIDTSALPTDENGQTLVARVNGQAITLAEYQVTLSRFEQQLLVVADEASLRAAVLGTLVEQALIDQQAASDGIAITEDELTVEVQTYIDQAGGAPGWNEWLRVNGYNEADFRDSLRQSMTVNRLRDRVTAPLNGNLPQVRARHILVTDEAEATAIMLQIQGGADFATVAAAFSIDMTTKDNGGDLGWFTREELLDATLADAAFSLEPGNIIGPIRTSLGYHILQTLERGERPVEEAKRPQLAQSLFNAWLQTLTQAAEIEYYLQG